MKNTKRISQLSQMLVAEYQNFNKSENLDNFPLGEFEIVGYFWGDKLLSGKHLTLNWFDKIVYLYECQCPKTKQIFTHAIGYANNYNSMWLLSLKKLKND